MIHCKDCEFFVKMPNGTFQLRCNPFATIKEPECLQKHQLMRLDFLVRAQQATMAQYKKMAPLQEKMFKHMERELQDRDDADNWKYEFDDEELDIDEDDPNNPFKSQ